MIITKRKNKITKYKKGEENIRIIYEELTTKIKLKTRNYN